MADFCYLPEKTPDAENRHESATYGQKPPLKPREVWAIRTQLQIEGKRRDLALFNLAIDSELRSCDLVALRNSDVIIGDSVRDRAVIVQQNTSPQTNYAKCELVAHLAPHD